MIHLDLDTEDARMLHEVLAADLSELGYEIANTDAKDYREMLRRKQEFLRRMVGELDIGA